MQQNGCNSIICQFVTNILRNIRIQSLLFWKCAGYHKQQVMSVAFLQKRGNINWKKKLNILCGSKYKVGNCTTIKLRQSNGNFHFFVFLLAEWSHRCRVAGLSFGSILSTSTQTLRPTPSLYSQNKPFCLLSAKEFQVVFDLTHPFLSQQGGRTLRYTWVEV